MDFLSLVDLLRMNNLEIISVLNRQFDEYFGFTDVEVKKICEDYNFAHKYDLIKERYNGYIWKLLVSMMPMRISIRVLWQE